MSRLGKKIPIRACVFTFSLKLEKWSFHVADLSIIIIIIIIMIIIIIIIIIYYLFGANIYMNILYSDVPYKFHSNNKSNIIKLSKPYLIYKLKITQSQKCKILKITSIRFPKKMSFHLGLKNIHCLSISNVIWETVPQSRRRNLKCSVSQCLFRFCSIIRL